MSDNFLFTLAGSPKTWLKERFTPGGIQRWLAEKSVSSYSDKMDILRDVDDRIYAWAKDLKRITKGLRQAIELSNLTEIANFINEFNDKLSRIKLVSTFVKSITPDDLQQFDKIRLAETKLSTAGAWEDIKRKWIAKKFETKDRNIRTGKFYQILELAEEISQKILSTLDIMGSARADGDIDNYIAGLSSISQYQNQFAEAFLPVYREYLLNISPDMPDVEDSDPDTDLNPTMKSPELEVPEQSMEWTPEPEVFRPEFTQPDALKLPTFMNHDISDDPTLEKIPVTQRSASEIYSQFLVDLVKTAQEKGDVQALAQKILIVSAEMEKYDPEAAMKLLQLAQDIIE